MNDNNQYDEVKKTMEENTGFLKERKASKKRTRKFFFVILLIVGVNVILFFALGWYERFASEKELDNAVEALYKAQREDYARALADTYGGKTPQETLRMYIDAVEKGDYELASKYFIGTKQEGELRSFNGVSKEGLEKYKSFLREALNDPGSYSEDKKGFFLLNPVLIDFKQYPNGIWKIIEI